MAHTLTYPRIETVGDLLEAAKDPSFQKGYEEGRQGLSKTSYSPYYLAGYHQGEITATRQRRSLSLPDTPDR